jgi:hypothetical protein
VLKRWLAFCFGLLFDSDSRRGPAHIGTHQAWVALVCPSVSKIKKTRAISVFLESEQDFKNGLAV